MDAVDRETGEGGVVRDENESVGAAHWVALILLAAAVLTAPLAAVRYGFRGFVTAHAIAIAAWPFAIRIRTRFAIVVGIAIALRLAMLLSPPQLSGDVYRYLWDGRVLASGRNPYALPPNDPSLATLRAPWQSEINHPEIRTIYPPHAEILFALFHQLTVWRLFLVACEVAILFMLRKERDPVIAYALFPPAIFEGAWNGHVEIVAALLLLIAWRYRSGAAAAAAVGMKVIPIAAVPALFARATRPRFAVAFALVLLIPALPFLVAGQFMSGMSDYATRWIFNSPAYDASFAIVDSLAVAQHLKTLWTSIKDPLHLEAISHFVYFHLYADFLARALLGVIAVALIVRWRRDPVASIGALLLCSPAIHPWYWIVVAPLALARISHKLLREGAIEDRRPGEGTRRGRLAPGWDGGSSWQESNAPLEPTPPHPPEPALRSDNDEGAPSPPLRSAGEKAIDDTERPQFQSACEKCGLAPRTRVWIALALCAPFSYLLYDGTSKWLVYALCYALPLVIAWLPLSTSASSAAGSPSVAIRSRTKRDTSRT